MFVEYHCFSNGVLVAKILLGQWAGQHNLARFAKGRSGIALE